MIDKKDIKEICCLVNGYWGEVLGESNQDFYRMAIGKEGGHQLGTELTSLLLHLSTRNIRHGVDSSIKEIILALEVWGTSG